MKRMIFTFVACVCMLPMVMGSAWAGFQNGADHLVDYQNGDGGWTWPYGISGGYVNSSPSNTAGPIGLGLLNAYSYTGDSDHLTSAQDAGDFVLATGYDNGETRFATFDPYFLLNLGGAWSTGAATDFFDELDNGTYGTSDFTTATWISAVQTGRTGTWVNLRPWEFSTIAYTAGQIGNTGQDTAFENAIIAGLGTLDTDLATASGGADYLGLAGGLYGLSLVDTDVGSATSVGDFGTVDSTTELAQLLVGAQNADGSWYWSSDLASPGESDKDAQITAYSVLALLEADAAGYGDWDSEIALARTWLWSMQQPDGSFLSYPGGTSNHEVEGEILQAVPEPMSMVMLGSLGAGMFAARRMRRRKK